MDFVRAQHAKIVVILQHDDRLIVVARVWRWAAEDVMRAVPFLYGESSAALAAPAAGPMDALAYDRQSAFLACYISTLLGAENVAPASLEMIARGEVRTSVH